MPAVVIPPSPVNGVPSLCLAITREGAGEAAGCGVYIESHMSLFFQVILDGRGEAERIWMVVAHLNLYNPSIDKVSLFIRDRTSPDKLNGILEPIGT
jgi:hypothetical protein